MKPTTRKLLFDIEQACRHIQDFARGKSIEDYETDAYFRSALDRQFQIAGEAVARLARADEETASRISEYRGIVRLRNVIVHGYDAVDPRILWDIVRNKLPVLQREVAALLSWPDEEA